MKILDFVPFDIESALEVIAELTGLEVAVDGAAVVGARTVHLVQSSGQTSSYSVSSYTSSIDSRVLRFCSCGHLCSGAYTPQMTTCSIEQEWQSTNLRSRCLTEMMKEEHENT